MNRINKQINKLKGNFTIGFLNLALTTESRSKYVCILCSAGMCVCHVRQFPFYAPPHKKRCNLRNLVSFPFVLIFHPPPFVLFAFIADDFKRCLHKHYSFDSDYLYFAESLAKWRTE